MFYQVSISLLALGLGFSALADEGIPHALQCLGTNASAVKRLHLAVSSLKKESTVSKSYLDGEQNPVGDTESFTVKSAGKQGKQFVVKTTWDGAFAGSGSREGILSYAPATLKGTWTEITKTYDEASDEQVEEKRTAAVACESIQ